MILDVDVGQPLVGVDSIVDRRDGIGDGLEGQCRKAFGKEVEVLRAKAGDDVGCGCLLHRAKLLARETRGHTRHNIRRGGKGIRFAICRVGPVKREIRVKLTGEVEHGDGIANPEVAGFNEEDLRDGQKDPISNR